MISLDLLCRFKLRAKLTLSCRCFLTNFPLLIVNVKRTIPSIPNQPCNPLGNNPMVSTGISFVGIVGVLAFLIFVAKMSEYRAYNIHIGAMFGSMMAFNVWYRIWPAQQKIITAIKNGEAPNPADAGMAGLRSKHNTYMSVPLIWTMINEHTVGVSHYLDGYGVLLVMIVLGWHLVWQLYKKSGTIKGF